MSHFQNPKNQGSIKHADGIGEAGNPICGDVMKIYIKVKDNKIKDIKFETLGCGVAIANSSILTEIAKGKSLVDANKVTNRDILKVLGDVPNPKIHCSMLAVEALRNAIKDYKKK